MATIVSSPDQTPGVQSDDSTSKPKFLRQMLRLAGTYWNGERRVKAWSATLLLLALTIGQVALTVWGNYWNRALYDALEQRSVRLVLVQVGVFALLTVSSMVVTAAHLMVKRWLQIDWRAWLTERLASDWLGDARHYRLLFVPGGHDNPDQRIAEDIRIATESAIGLAHSLTYCVLTLGLFINILWSVSGGINVPGTSVHIPGYMVPLAFVYAILGSLFGWTFGRPLVHTTNALQTAEATFRFGLSRVREHTESIALMHGEHRERTASAARFSDIIHSWNRQSFAFLGLLSFSTVYGSLLPVLPILVAAPQYISGAMSLGALMQAAQAFERLTSSLSWPVDSIGDIASCRASADRVFSLYSDMRRLDATADTPDRHAIALTPTEHCCRLVMRDLCIAEPSGRVLVEGLNDSLARGERVLVTGDPAATGALFKVLGGLWPWGDGNIEMPAGDTLFLAQRPFLPEGTLREAITYPRPPQDYCKDDMGRALECVGLTRLTPRLDEHDNWEQTLPARVQQQLGLARALLLQPAWIFMEEATGAFDARSERQILEMLHRELPNTAILNISFHSGLDDLHNRTMQLNRPAETKVLFGQRREENGTHESPQGAAEETAG